VITVNADKCIGCGLCVKVCHNRCVALVDAIANINTALCDRCTQCIAVCPQQALSWGDVLPVRYDKTQRPSPEQLDELFKERRSIRFFKKDSLDRSLVEEIVNYGIYAPTNNHNLRAVVVTDRRAIEALERIVVRFNARIYELFFKPELIFALLSRLSSAVNPHVRVKLEERRHDLFNPAAMVLVVGDQRIAFSEASAQAALDHMTFYAWVHGVGSCLWGAGQIILDRNRAARERLGLQRREHILGILLLGYPAVNFVNRVEGRRMDIQWLRE